MPDSHKLDTLRHIFYCERKIELEKFCKNANISQSDFSALIVACESGVIPWHHQIHCLDFVPEHLKPTKEEHAAFSTVPGVGPLKDEAAKMMRKIRQTGKERRYLVGHIFFTPTLNNWHFFYFDQRDTAIKENHWSHGPHIHLINHLWPNHNAQTLWAKFRSGEVNLNGSIHIKFIKNVGVSHP